LLKKSVIAFIIEAVMLFPSTFMADGDDAGEFVGVEIGDGDGC
jgi:hypothetical protein